jgi:membrane associated rhomboid family serine protease
MSRFAPQLTALPSRHRPRQWWNAVRSHLGLLFGAVILVWGVEFIDWVLRGALNEFGIHPRSVPGLIGIAASPFLHANFEHLISNTVPFLVLGGVVLMAGRQQFLMVTISILAMGGGMLWTLGPGGTNHIGASLLIFGYLGYLLARGFFERSPFWIMISLFTLLLYGGMVVGVLPGEKDVSWQGHLFGFVGGIVTARVLCPPRVGSEEIV